MLQNPPKLSNLFLIAILIMILQIQWSQQHTDPKAIEQQYRKRLKNNEAQCMYDSNCPNENCCIMGTCQDFVCHQPFPFGHACLYDYNCQTDSYCWKNVCIFTLPDENQCDDSFQCHTGCCHNFRCNYQCDTGQKCRYNASCISQNCDQKQKHCNPAAPQPIPSPTPPPPPVKQDSSSLSWYWILTISLLGIVFLALLFACIVKLKKQRDQKIKRIAQRRYQNAVFEQNNRQLLGQNQNDLFLDSEDQDLGASNFQVNISSNAGRDRSCFVDNRSTGVSHQNY